MKWSTKSLGNGYKSIFNLQNGKESRKTVSRSINNDQVPGDEEYATAVLAATFAIHSLEEGKRTPQNKNERRKKGNRNGAEPHSNEVTRRPSYNNEKTAGEASMRKPKLQDHGAVETRYPARTPRRSSSFRSTPVADARERVEKHEKLKSVLAWANDKKMKAKNKIERTKSELELKITKKPATLPKQGRYYL